VLKKLQLDLTKSYEICVATEKIANMVVSYVQGRSHALTLGCEQGDIPKWDDLIIELSDGTLEHIQIKRNFSDFDGHKCDRNSDLVVRRATGVAELRDLSPIDESLKALAEWTEHNDPRTSNPKRKFSVAVPTMQTLIKEGLPVRYVYDFCRSISASTTAASIASIALTHMPTSNIYLWLTTWCDFQDWDHILRAFRNLDIVQAGTETEIEIKTEEQLALCFSDTEAVRKQIHTFINDNSTYTSAITPRPLFGKLKSYWLPGLTPWTQYINTGTDWEITGINDHDFDQVETAESVIDGFWKSENPNLFRFHGNTPNSNSLPSAIMRMILHLPRPAIAHIQNSAIWQERTKNFVGGTLGTAEEDCNDLAVLECTDMYNSSDNRSLTKLDEIDLEGKKLNNRMNALNWLTIVKTVSEKISSLPSSALRSAIEHRWIEWRTKLDVDFDEQVILCQSMLHPEAEGEEILSLLRLGPKTVILVSKGIILLLAVAVALSDSDEGWKTIGNGLSVGNKALIYWSGPSGKKRKIRLFTDEGISALVGREPTKILILSGVVSTTSEIKESSLAESSGNPYNLASPHQPALLITHSMKFSQLIRNGDLTALRDYIFLELSKSTSAKKEQLNTIVS